MSVDTMKNQSDEIEERADLTHVQSVAGLSISPELFEKLYLTPKTPRIGDNVKRFANPTPLGFVGFVISTMTFSMVLMGWGGASGFTPLAPSTSHPRNNLRMDHGQLSIYDDQALFCVFWLSFGLLQFPTLGLAAAYSPDGDATQGAKSPEFNAVLAIYLLVWGFALFTFFILTLKTNLVNAMTFLLVSTASWVLSGAYWRTASGDYVMAGHLQTAGGAILFVVGLLGWYMTIVIMAAEMRITVSLPVGDLSHYWPKTDIEIAAVEQRAAA